MKRTATVSLGGCLLVLALPWLAFGVVLALTANIGWGIAAAAGLLAAICLVSALVGPALR